MGYIPSMGISMEIYPIDSNTPNPRVHRFGTRDQIWPTKYPQLGSKTPTA